MLFETIDWGGPKKPSFIDRANGKSTTAGGQFETRALQTMARQKAKVRLGPHHSMRGQIAFESLVCLLSGA
ncbi:hypothetical protein FJW05_08130 [Mesorhizobium sp. B2-9-1]|uniref:hypothetical protein n=1 Tax=unclassified Mesorhizobium TaxID=325217 RepID=UPI00112B6C67|nr:MULTISPECIES: hypothetical protein [unclassified Mesorhizobium]TPI48023.1 hypothetical protein FJW05_08130 [Mesorhizobium sp. B2-9-1]TPO12621.1 hypothetical protein FJ980_02510 [Mesorhizobium sp. B1-1-5]